MRNASLKQILKLMEKKYPGIVALIIYDDESGRITEHPGNAYDEPALFEFGKDAGIEKLVKHLKEKK